MSQVHFNRSSGMLMSLVGFILMPCSSLALAADPVVGWREVQTAVDAVAVEAGNVQSASVRSANVLSANGTRGKESDRFRAEARVSADSLDRLGASLPPPPRSSGSRSIRGAAVDHVQPTSLAGISSSVVPAVTGDLYWSRPILDMRVIGQSLGQNSSLRLTRPPVGVSVGSTSTSTKPALVGIK